jgi:hypothetical protein
MAAVHIAPAYESVVMAATLKVLISPGNNVAFRLEMGFVD